MGGRGNGGGGMGDGDGDEGGCNKLQVTWEGLG